MEAFSGYSRLLRPSVSGKRTVLQLMTTPQPVQFFDHSYICRQCEYNVAALASPSFERSSAVGSKLSFDCVGNFAAPKCSAKMSW